MSFIPNYKTFSHPGQPQMQVEVILASRGANGAPPIYTIRLRYPRIIHAEIMTHRVFSRNARSSRAVPVKTMLLETTTIPFIPWHWHKNQRGMQGKEPLNEAERKEAVALWLEPLPHLVAAVEKMQDPTGLSIHKQVPNRLLEPYMWIDVLVTATDWANFLHLRDHKDAEPHLQDLARLVKQAIEEAEVRVLQEGEWHLPYITQDDWVAAAMSSLADNMGRDKWLARISAARCARISYAPFDGDASYERELERYNQLVTHERIHASPLEHQAKVDALVYDYGEKVFAYEDLSGNLAPGWVQYRKTVPGECFDG